MKKGRDAVINNKTERIVWRKPKVTVANNKNHHRHNRRHHHHHSENIERKDSSSFILEGCLDFYAGKLCPKLVKIIVSKEHILLEV